MEGNNSSRVSLIDLGDPGKLTIKQDPLVPAICLDRMAVGTYFREMDLILSPNPGKTLSQTAFVASGVTSLGAGPVPPVVKTREQPRSSLKCIKASDMSSILSGTSFL